MVLGLPSSGSVILTTQLALNVPYNALYVQDDYRVTPKLSINYGFRYEHEPGIHERDNHYAVGLDPPSPIRPQRRQVRPSWAA